MHNLTSTQSFIKINQGEIYYQTFGSGKPIVVLHGGPGGDMYPFLPHMLELAKDHEVTFYDQRGCGRSAQTQFTDEFININQYVKDLDDVINYLGYTQVVLITHSWGVKLAIEYLQKYSKKVSKIVFISPVPTTQKGSEAFLNEFIIPRMEMFKIFGDTELIKSSTDLELENSFRKVYAEYLWDKNSAKHINLEVTKEVMLRVAQVQHLMKEPSDKDYFFEKLKNINAPCLVIHGDSDPIPLWTAKETSAALPNAKMVELKECGHAPFLESSREFFKTFREFLSA